MNENSTRATILAQQTHEADRIVVEGGLAWKYLRDHGSYAGVTPAEREQQIRLRECESQIWPELNPLYYDADQRCLVSPYIIGRLPTRQEVRDAIRNTRLTGRNHLSDISATNMVVHSTGRPVVVDFIVDTKKRDFGTSPCWSGYFGSAESCRSPDCCNCNPGRDGSRVVGGISFRESAILLLAKSVDDVQRCAFAANALRDSGITEPIQIWCRRHSLDWATVNVQCWNNDIRFVNVDSAVQRLPAEHRSEAELLAYALLRLPFDSVLVVAGITAAKMTVVAGLLQNRQSAGGAKILGSDGATSFAFSSSAELTQALERVNDGCDLLLRADRYRATFALCAHA